LGKNVQAVFWFTFYRRHQNSVKNLHFPPFFASTVAGGKVGISQAFLDRIMSDADESISLNQQSEAKKLEVWIVDDNYNIRSLIGELLGLQADIECARQFSSPNQILSALASHPGPDVILLDVQLGDHNGIDAVRLIKSLAPGPRVLMFPACFDPAWRERALSEGASDYLLKTNGIDRILEQIRLPANDANPLTRFRRRSKRHQRGQSHAVQSPKQNGTSKKGFSFLRGWWN